jgi:drug/metabolite transporter (DMT)-like permease
MSKKTLFGVMTVVSVVATAVVIGFAVNDALSKSRDAVFIFLVAGCVHAIVLLFYLREIRLNRLLTQQQRERWNIVVFMGMAVGQAAYFIKYIAPVPALGSEPMSAKK